MTLFVNAKLEKLCGEIGAQLVDFTRDIATAGRMTGDGLHYKEGVRYSRQDDWQRCPTVSKGPGQKEGPLLEWCGESTKVGGECEQGLPQALHNKKMHPRHRASNAKQRRRDSQTN